MILPAERLRARLQHGDRLRQALLVDEEGVRLRLGDAMRKRHRLGRGGRLVEQRGVGDIERGQIRDERLEVEKRLETPLADLRLIGRVGGIPGRILQDVALDGRRHDRAVVALADQRGQHAVLVRRLAHPIEHAAFGQRRAEIERRLLADRLRHGLLDQLIETPYADDAQHLRHLFGRRPDVTTIGEVVRLVSFGGVMNAPLSRSASCRRPRP